jgi:NAD(P)-dependent dehydrogenase (short-subunit alcohol dehydrogenase family)
MSLLPDFLSVNGRTAIVTGAASGIGKSTVLMFAAAGARVVAVDMDAKGAEATVEEAKGNGGDAIALHADVTGKASVEAMVGKAHGHYGRIDFLVNSAGVTKRFPAVDFPEDEWDRIIDINLKGSFLCAQAVGRHMIEQSFGRIINIASIAGIAGYANTVAYQSSKGGVVQMSRALAAEWGKYNITVNAVAPGIVMTPMQEVLRQQDPARFEAFLSKMAIGKPSSPEDIAAAVYYLCTPRAALVTGHVLPVDGGYLAL